MSSLFICFTLSLIIFVFAYNAFMQFVLKCVNINFIFMFVAHFSTRCWCWACFLIFFCPSFASSVVHIYIENILKPNLLAICMNFGLYVCPNEISGAFKKGSRGVKNRSKDKIKSRVCERSRSHIVLPENHCCQGLGNFCYVALVKPCGKSRNN